MTLGGKLGGILCAGMALVFALLVTITFVVAYMSPTKSVMVTIDNYGEANIELLFLIGGLVCVCVLTLPILSPIVEWMLQVLLTPPSSWS